MKNGLSYKESGYFMRVATRILSGWSWLEPDRVWPNLNYILPHGRWNILIMSDLTLAWVFVNETRIDNSSDQLSSPLSSTSEPDG